MKTPIIIVAIVVSLVSVGLSGCVTQKNNENKDNNITNSEMNKFIGSWENTTTNGSTTIQFHSDGAFLFRSSDITTHEIYNYTGTWDLTNDTLNMHFKELGFNLPRTYVFSNNNSVLSLRFSSGDIQVFTKK